MRTSNSGTKLDQSWPFALADGEVSFVGEPVAIVVAEDRYIAEDAAALVAVDYDVLPAATDCRRRARAAGAPRATFERGDLLQGRLWRRRCGFRQGGARRARRSVDASRRRPFDRGPRHSRPNLGSRNRGLGLDPEGARSAHRLRRLYRSRRKPAARGDARCRRRLRAEALRLSRGRRGGRRGDAAAAARSNGSKTAASISPMRRRSATSIGRSRLRPMAMAACAACAAA